MQQPDLRLLPLVTELPPVLSGIPSDVTVECDDVPSAPVTITATDNCDPQVDITMDETVQPLGCQNDFRLIRTWTATDDCGNVATGSQIITVQDTEAPTLMGVPADITVDCNNIPPISGNVTASDNCDDQVQIDFEEIVNGGGCAANQSNHACLDCHR
ncbi:MAG: hypothetical protein R2784_14085 [Saprospiraceae bacterium]